MTSSGLTLPAAYPARVRLEPTIARELLLGVAGGVLTERIDATVADVLVDAAGVWRIGLEPVGAKDASERWSLIVDGANSPAATGGFSVETAPEGPPRVPTPSDGGALEPPFRERDPVTVARFARWDPANSRVRESVLVTRRTAARPTDSDPEFIGIAPSDLDSTAEPGDDVLLAFGEAPAPAGLLSALPQAAHVSPSTELVYLEARRDSRSCLRLTEHFRFWLGAPGAPPAGLRAPAGLSGASPQLLTSAPPPTAPPRVVAPGESADIRSAKQRWVFRAIELSSPAEEETCQPAAGPRSAWLLVWVGTDSTPP